MSDLIQWPSAKYWDKAWNPMIGCEAISPACANCYAREWAIRYRMGSGDFSPHYTSRDNPPRSGVVFCGNMTDIFGGWVDPLESVWFINQTLGRADKAVYLSLPKRADRMCDVLRKAEMYLKYKDGNMDDCAYLPRDCEMSNQFFGFTAENQECYDERRLNVLGKPDGFPMWTKWWVSCEPLLEPIHLWMPPAFRAPSWIVVGCESGPHRRPCKLEWVESIVEQCRTAGVPVFVKQLDIVGKCVTDINQFPEHLRIRQVPWTKTTKE